MYLLEVLNGEHWETVAEFFDSAEDAELYYEHQLFGVFDGYRILEEVL